MAKRDALLFLTIVMFFLTAVAKTEPSIVENPIAMTLTQAVSFPTKNGAKTAKINVLNLRGPTRLLEDRHDLRIRYALQADRTAPLVFIIPGTGGTASSPGALALAEKIHDQGYQTVTIDNAFSWTFAVAGSSSSLPGYTPDDAKDLYSALQKVRHFLANKHRVKPRSFSIVGYSLGALQALFLKKIDDRENQFRFTKLLMINTPVDLLYALNGIDALYERGMRLDLKRRDWVYRQVIVAGEKYLGNGMSIDFGRPEFLSAAFDDLNFDDEDMIFLVGKTFRDSLRDVIFASQQVHDRHVLKTPVGKYLRNARNAEAARYSYLDYINEFLLPALRAKTNAALSLADLNERASLYQFGDYISRQAGIFAIHSEDDFLLRPQDLDWMRRTFGRKLYLFRYGGHLGAMNFPEFTERLNGLFPKAP